MVANIKKVTPNLGLRIPIFDRQGWGREFERNFDILDATITAATGVINVVGVWANTTSYTSGQRVVDEITTELFTCIVSHTSAASGAFSVARANNPTYWELLTTAVNYRGAWANTTVYNLNDVVFTGQHFAIAKTTGTSDTSLANDVSEGLFSTIVNFTAEYADILARSINLPVVDGDIIPDADGTRDLGSATNRFAELHVDDILGVQSINGGPLGGFHNKLINPLGTINQRGYVSGAATSGTNVYTLDRWRVVVSGQNLAWTESEGVRTMTAPAGGVEQVIEGAAILSGTHVLNWVGTATATVGGTARTKGEVFTLTGGANLTVRFTSGTFSLPQLENASSVTAFSPRHIQQETALCQRYCFVGLPTNNLGFSYSIARDGVSGCFGSLPVTMRVVPSATGLTAFTYTNSSFDSWVASKDGWLLRVTVTTNGYYRVYGGTVLLDAEI